MSGRSAELGRLLAGAMQIGTVTSVAVMVAGVVLGRPVIAWYGLLLLTLTPALQLGAAAIGFARLRELHYSLVATAVLALLLAGLAAALVGRGLGG
jgi:uncharacterized membrane protein